MGRRLAAAGMLNKFTKQNTIGQAYIIQHNHKEVQQKNIQLSISRLFMFFNQ